MLTDPQQQLLQTLSDGRFHSGQSLAEVAGCSRTAIWKRLQKLQAELGLSVDAVKGKGYRLQKPLHLLDKNQILGMLSQDAGPVPELVEVVLQLGSTNTRAQELILRSTANMALVFAEHQSAGRGRRGREWVSPFGCNLYMSLAMRFELPITALAGLSLSAGVVIAEYLSNKGVEGIGLKWPNDLYLNGAKFGGLLLEAQGETSGPSSAVVGLGLNLVQTAEMEARIDQPYTSLQSLGICLDRSVLAGGLANTLLQMCDTYLLDGITPFIDRWARFDIFRGQHVCLSGPSLSVHGTCEGVAPDGGLLLRTQQGLQTFHSGELSLRRVDT